MAYKIVTNNKKVRDRETDRRGYKIVMQQSLIDPLQILYNKVLPQY